MGTPKGTQRKIKSNNFKYKQQLKKSNQLTPAHQTFGKGQLERVGPFCICDSCFPSTHRFDS